MTRSSSYYFWLTVFLGGIFLAVFLTVLWNAMPFAVIGFHDLLGHIGDFCERLNKTSELALYGITFGFFILAAAVMRVLGPMIFFVLKMSVVRRGADLKQKIDKKILKAVGRTALERSDIIFTNSGHSPFCAGLWKPKIFISRDFSKRFNVRELSVVLLHEKQHLKSFDVLKTSITRFFCSFFLFMPIFKILAQKYFLTSELEADARASARFKYRHFLLSAINKIRQSQYSSIQPLGISSAVNMRIGFLLSLEDFPKIIVSKRQIIQSVILFVAAVFIFLLSFHFNHALSMKVLKYRDGQMTPIAWNNVSFFDSSNLYLTPINQTANITQCAGEPKNFSHL